MKIEDGQFLDEGISRYEEGRDTIIAFELGIGRILKQTVDNRKDWRPLKDKKIDTKTYVSNVRFGYCITIYITGKSPRDEETIIDCGLWWKWSEVTGPFIYASYEDNKPKRVANFAWNNNLNNIKSFSTWHRRFIYLPLRKVADIDKGLNSLLNALLKQLV